ncbi:putative transposable element, partial [Pseudoloma neurophilia]
LFVTKLRGVARAWCSELMEARDWQVDIKILKKEIKLRFLNASKSITTLTGFLKKPPPKTREEFTSLVSEATILAEKDLMSLTALAQIIMDRSPESIKPLLYLATQEAKSWTQFTEKASKLIHVGFSDAVLNTIQSDNSVKQISTMGNKKCLWHGENQSHNTDNCFKVQKLVKQAKDRYDG